MQEEISPRTLVTYAVCMAATVYLSLWAVIGLIGPPPIPTDGLIGPPSIPTGVPRKTPAVAPVAPAAAPPDPPEPPPIVAGISGVPGDSSALVGQMQRALAKKGYRVSADDNFDADTVTALQAFQDAKALTVYPTCDRQCWNALGLPDPK